MARGINKVILVGNLGGDPDQRAMPSGNAVTKITVATSESWKDKQTGQQQERTEWHNVIFFNRLAEVAGQYLSKGAKVYVEGSLRTRKYQGQDGQDCYITEVIASEMQMLDSRRDSQQGEYQPPQGQPQQQQRQPPNNRRNPNGTQQSPYAQQPPAGGMDPFDDDIPFAPCEPRTIA